MAQTIGQMWQSATVPAPGATAWVPANGQYLRATEAKGYVKAFGTRWHPKIPWRVKMPTAAGWWVCILDNAGTAPPDNTTVKNPPYAPFVQISIRKPPQTVPGSVDVYADVWPLVAMECAITTGGTPGAYTAMTHNPARGQFYVSKPGVASGAHTVRVRPVAFPLQEVDAGAFTLV